MPAFALTPLDIGVVLAYGIGIVLLGLWLGRGQESTDDYFLAGRSLGWGVIGLSLFASNMSTSSLVGMAGEAYGGVGIAVYNYEWMAGIVLVLFCAFFLPFYIKTGIYTLPEFLERRFDGRSRLYFSGWTVFLNITVDTASALYAGSLVVALIYPGVPMSVSVMVLALLAGLYTIAGGLKAVVYTDAIQAVLLLAGSAAVAWIGWSTVQAQGGWDAVAAVTPEAQRSLILPADHPSLPWPGLLTGVFILGFYFWATNQFMVQRTLAARTLQQGRWGALFAGLLKLPVLFLMVLPGSFARVLYPGLERADAVFPTMVFDLLPDGLRALVLTAMVAAIMSSVDSTLNSASTLVTMDFYKRFRPAASSKQLATVGKVVTALFMVFAALWAPVILQFDTLWGYLQSFLAYVVPPFVALFVVGVFWRRATASAAFWSVMAGHAASAALFVAGPVLGLVDVPFLYVPAILLAVGGLTLFLVSRAQPAPDPARIADVTWTPALWREDSAALAALPWWQSYRVQGAALLALTAVVVGLFW